MTDYSRRRLLRSGLWASAALSLPLAGMTGCNQRRKAKVLVIGAGFAGATAARYLAMWDPSLDITLIERHTQFISCPQSNMVLSDSRQLTQLTRDYRSMSLENNLQFRQARVEAIDTERQQVYLTGGERLAYDRLIIAPGIELVYDNLPMLASPEAQQHIPHAWKAGPQTDLLRRQIGAMPTGGTVVMTVPMAPYRCPPGPYERACHIALYLKRHNPTAKLLVLDANPDITSKKDLFVEAWQQLYPGLIEYIPTSGIDSVDVAQRSVETLFDSYQADVLNVIPPQRAGKVAEMAGVINIDERWCDVDYLTYESTAVPKVHVIGDVVAAKVPKSGHIANQQAKVCAAAVINLLKDQQPEQMPVFSNTCYSFIDDKQAGHVAAVYRYDADSQDMLPMPGGGVSPHGSELEGRYAEAWAQNIWVDMLGPKRRS